MKNQKEFILYYTIFNMEENNKENIENIETKKRKSVLNLYIDENFKEKLREEAKKMNISLSDYVRLKLQGKI